MKIEKDETVCGLCREIIKTKDSVEYISGYSWGSISGSASYDLCCKKCAKTKLKPNKEVIGRPYA